MVTSYSWQCLLYNMKNHCATTWMWWTSPALKCVLVWWLSEVLFCGLDCINFLFCPPSFTTSPYPILFFGRLFILLMFSCLGVTVHHTAGHTKIIGPCDYRGRNSKIVKFWYSGANWPRKSIHRQTNEFVKNILGANTKEIRLKEKGKGKTTLKNKIIRLGIYRRIHLPA